MAAITVVGMILVTWCLQTSHGMTLGRFPMSVASRDPTCLSFTSGCRGIPNGLYPLCRGCETGGFIQCLSGSVRFGRCGLTPVFQHGRFFVVQQVFDPRTKFCITAPDRYSCQPQSFPSLGLIELTLPQKFPTAKPTPPQVGTTRIPDSGQSENEDGNEEGDGTTTTVAASSTSTPPTSSTTEAVATTKAIVYTATTPVPNTNTATDEQAPSAPITQSPESLYKYGPRSHNQYDPYYGNMNNNEDLDEYQRITDSPEYLYELGPRRMGNRNAGNKPASGSTERPGAEMNPYGSGLQMDPYGNMAPYGPGSQMDPYGNMDLNGSRSQMDPYGNMDPYDPGSQIDPYGNMGPYSPGSQMDPYGNMDPYGPGSQMNPYSPGSEMDPYGPGSQMGPYENMDPYGPGSEMDPYYGNNMRMRKNLDGYQPVTEDEVEPVYEPDSDRNDNLANPVGNEASDKGFTSESRNDSPPYDSTENQNVDEDDGSYFVYPYDSEDSNTDDQPSENDDSSYNNPDYERNPYGNDNSNQYGVDDGYSYYGPWYGNGNYYDYEPLDEYRAIPPNQVSYYHNSASRGNKTDLDSGSGQYYRVNEGGGPDPIYV